MQLLRITLTEILRFVFVVPTVFLLAFIRRITYSSLQRNRVFLGFGPVPIGLNHAKAVRSIGVRAESFSTHHYSLGGDIDVRIYTSSKAVNFLSRFFCIPIIFAIFRYSHLVFYFDGGAFGHGSVFSWRVESILLRIAGVKTIVTAYGSDVHSTRLMRNLELKNGYTLDYPMQWVRNKQIESRITYWCKNADFVIAGCDWVDYLPTWDKLILSHFTIDTKSLETVNRRATSSGLRVLHAPNHRNLKGTEVIERVIQELRCEGLDVELTLLSGVTHSEVLSAFASHDLVIDQLIIGWYGQFAIESLSNGVPTVCYISEEYKKLYSTLYASEGFDLPFIEANTLNLKDVIREAYINRRDLEGLSEKGRNFVERYHSFQKIGQLFIDVVKKID